MPRVNKDRVKAAVTTSLRTLQKSTRRMTYERSMDLTRTHFSTVFQLDPGDLLSRYHKTHPAFFFVFYYRHVETVNYEVICE